MTRNNGQHSPPSAQDRARRTRTIVALVLVGLAALAVGVFLGSRASEDAASPSTPPASSVTPSPTQEPTETVSASPDDSPTDEPAPAVLDEGQHFVLAKEVVQRGGGDALVLDLGYFLTGDEANEAAAEDGLETPVPNDYYIVNDNPKLRTVPLSPDAAVRYIPADPCCDLQPWDLDAWMDVVNGEVMSDMMGEMSSTWWWVTVRDGAIVEIEQQYLP